MHRAIGIGADLTQLAFLAAISNDSLRHVLARLVLRRVRLVFVFRLLLPDFDILISRYNRATFDTFAVGIVICTCPSPKFNPGQFRCFFYAISEACRAPSGCYFLLSSAVFDLAATSFWKISL